MCRALIFFFAALVLSSCAETPRAAISANAAPPRSVELADEQTLSTIHFPRGVYFLDASDSSGWFYRAPNGVIQHGFGTFVRHDGGIFLARTNGAIRGYVIWAGGRTKLGNLSDAKFLFRE